MSESITSVLDSTVLAELPSELRMCLLEKEWWADETRLLRVMKGLDELAPSVAWHGYSAQPTATSPRWPWKGRAVVHDTSVLHSGVNFFGPVVIGPNCEIGPNATIFGPSLIESNVYLGPSVEVRRCMLLDHAEISHMSYVGHSVIGRGVRLGAFFCAAVRNLRRGTVHIYQTGSLVDTGELHLGCAIADGMETGVHTTVMPGRRLVGPRFIPPNSVITNNC